MTTKKVMALCLCGLLVTACDTVPIEDVLDVNIVSDIELRKTSAQKFEDFKSAARKDSRRFSAMAVTSNGSGGAIRIQQPTLEQAKSAALEGCQKRNPQSTCVLYATASPRKR